MGALKASRNRVKLFMLHNYSFPLGQIVAALDTLMVENRLKNYINSVDLAK